MLVLLQIHLSPKISDSTKTVKSEKKGKKKIRQEAADLKQ